MGEIIVKNVVDRQPGFLYYIDGEGNVCQAEMARKPKNRREGVKGARKTRSDKKVVKHSVKGANQRKKVKDSKKGNS